MPKENVTIKRKPVSKDQKEAMVSLLEKGKPLDLTEEQYTRLAKDVEAEFEAIKQERGDIHSVNFDSFMDSMDNQRRGKMPKSAKRAYNLDTRLTPIKCGDIKNAIVSSLLGVDPPISVTPRPGYALEGGSNVCNQQQEFIDYALDERIPIRKPLSLAASSAVYKKVGMLKWVHKVRKEKRIRQEKFKGEPSAELDAKTGQIIRKNPGLEDFLLSYGDCLEKYPAKYQWIADRLIEGKEVEFDAEYDEIVYNDPFPVFVDNRNFYVRKDTDGYIGLCETKATIERVPYSYYQLKKFEEEYDFINIDKLIEDEKTGKPRDGYEKEKFDVLEVVFHFRLNEDDDEYTKILCFFHEKDMLYLGGVFYPYTTIDSYYVPHYVTEEEAGFYQLCPAEALTDPHLAKNAIFNHTLEGAHMATTISPIAPKGSDTDIQMLEGTWANGMTMYADDPKALDFVSNKIKPFDIQSLLVLNSELSRLAGEITKVSDLRSGKETPLDPNAPASKVAMLLQESGRGVKEYVDVFKDGFNIDAQIILRMYYEIGLTEYDYIDRRTRAVAGTEIKKISRAAMIARTNIQSQAMAYDFNKLQAKREDFAMNEFLKGEGLIVGNPRANYERIRLMVAGYGPKWKNSLHILLPPWEEFQRQQSTIALQATMKYFEAAARHAQATGQPPQLDPDQMIAFIGQLQAKATMPAKAREEIEKQEKKQAKEAVA